MIDIKFFFIILFLWFLPEITLPLFRIIYCYIKRRINNCYRCYFWDCPKYNTCYFNSKTLLDIPFFRVRTHDLLSVIVSLFHTFFNIMIFILVLVVYYGC